MKKQVLLMMVTLIAMTFTVLAQKDGSKPANNPKSRAEQMAKDLNLTDAQKQEVQVLFEEQMAKTKELTQAGDTEAVKSMRKTWNEKLETIIGKENMVKHKAIMAERRASQDKKNNP